MTAKQVVWVDLVMENGEIVSIECPAKFEDDLHESLSNSMRRNDRWSCQQWDGCTATYMGHHMDSINMAKVVGTL